MRHRTDRVRVGFALAFVFALVCVGLLVSVSPARADHGTIAWSDQLQVAGATGFADAWPAVVADGHGYVYVFYYTTNSGLSTTNVNVTKIQAVGPSGVPRVLFTTQVNDVANVASSFILSAVIDHSGNLYVAWTRATSTLGQEIYVSKSTNGGATWQVAVRANAPNAAGDDSWPTMTVTPDGTLYVAWVQHWGSRYAVSVSKSTDGGASFASWTNVTMPFYVWSPAIASDARGRVYVAYAGLLTASSTNYDMNVTWSDDGVTWAAWKTLTSSQQPGVFPALAVDAHGTVHLAWFAGIGSNYQIRTSLSMDRGASWSTSIALTPSGASGTIGYLAVEGDTLLYVWGPAANFGWIVSGNDGGSWYPPQYLAVGQGYATVAADQNGTFWAAYTLGNNIDVRRWVGPPSSPVVTGVASSGTNGLTLTWTASPEQNVASYEVWRSGDGSTYQIVATVGATGTSFTDGGLANGTYWYKVTAVNNQGTPSHDSNAVSAVVGLSIQQLESDIAALQNQLAQANASSAASIAAARAQITALQNALTNLQNSQITSNAATAAQLARLQANLTLLQNELTNLQSQQATQTISYANLAFEVIVVVLLVVLLLNQMRRPRVPQMMMMQPAPPEPKRPEDEL